MQSNFIYSNNNKRYHTYDYYLHQKYSSKVAKIALNAGFSCPHIVRNGRGCIYCGEKYHSKNNNLLSPQEIVQQFDEKKQMIEKKWKSTKYIAYFQAGSNTFASLVELEKIYESVLDTENLVGIDIATRPDCIDEKIAEYLSELNRRTDMTVELGLQTCHDATAKIINRGYTLDVFEKAYKILSDFKIPVSAHIINSLPGESPGMMIETARYIANLDPLPLGVKIHMLYVEENTELYDLYISGEIYLMTKEEYIDTVVKQLEILPPQIVLMRLTGDPELSDGEKPIPSWVRKKFVVINDIDKQLEKRDTYQGILSGKKFK
ncbi:MAG: TIGR01212 family radical SAM protein [Oscillospiraceae bacterium]|nr:TIGR01212 family radical SAM protein [Oscillospiraceae bacterium]